MNLYNDPMDRRKIIIDRYSNPLHKGSLDVKPIMGYSTRCADKLALYIKWDNKVIADVKAETVGCAVFVASTDIFLDYMIGKTKDEIIALANMFNKLIEQEPVEKEKLKTLIIFDNVKTHLNRVDCANIIIKTIIKNI